jgi:hypothetical protein
MKKAALRIDMSSASASFKGLQIIPSTPPILLAADFHNAKIDAFDANYAPITADAGALTWGPNTPQAADAGTLPTQLFFTSGPNGEDNGLYGYLTAP